MTVLHHHVHQTSIRNDMKTFCRVKLTNSRLPLCKVCREE